MKEPSDFLQKMNIAAVGMIYKQGAEKVLCQTEMPAIVISGYPLSVSGMINATAQSPDLFHDFCDTPIGIFNTLQLVTIDVGRLQSRSMFPNERYQWPVYFMGRGSAHLQQRFQTLFVDGGFLLLRHGSVHILQLIDGSR